MKYYELDKEEQAQLDEVESGVFVSVADVEKAKQTATLAAKNTLNKTATISLRLSEKDVYKLKAKAAQAGLPYQTLAASILHQSTLV
jgi:predicted DNA binding CopG/RHH family protein